MLDRLQFRVQSIDQFLKRKQRKKEMWARHQQFMEFIEREKKRRADND